MQQTTRRQFLAVSAAAVAAPMIIPRSVLGTPQAPGANDTVTVGVIGLGGRYRDIHYSAVMPTKTAKVVAVSEFFKPRLDDFLKATDGQGIKGYDDFRTMIETENPDGIMAMTATHQRAWVSAIGMQMGAHLYIEKPMCLTIEEGRYLVNAARKYNRVTQVGTQQRSLPLCNWACDMIADGAIGKIRYIEAPNFVGPRQWVDQPGQPMPDGGRDDWWDIWTNQAVFRPYHRDLQYGWDRWWDYDAGGTCFGVSGWGTHSYDQVNRVLGMNETGPVGIILMEACEERECGKFANAKLDDDDTGAEYYGLARGVFGPRAEMRMLFENCPLGVDNKVELRLNLDGDKGPGLGCIVTGERGKIEINRHKLSSNPKELVAKLPEDAQWQIENKGAETTYHFVNWIDCIKSGERCTADIEYGQRSTTLCELVNIVRTTAEVRRLVRWDPVAERFANNDKGNEMLSRPRRKGYELPELG
ncbi:MAG: Gfo/Idh/MocA family oxidoreductase [Planctomycetaceae bacterium]|nr:Gfo/Idh/MocA family oxidoreductase [Planctomycetaceae bacterium]